MLLTMPIRSAKTNLSTTLPAHEFCAPALSPCRNTLYPVPCPSSPCLGGFGPIYIAFHARNCAHPNAQTDSAHVSPRAPQNVATQQFATNAPNIGEPAIAQNAKFYNYSPKIKRKMRNDAVASTKFQVSPVTA
jgi:hypothetical protein